MIMITLTKSPCQSRPLRFYRPTRIGIFPVSFHQWNPTGEKAMEAKSLPRSILKNVYVVDCVNKGD